MKELDESTPLEGVIVADFTRVLAGPYCALLLADLGAEVIKVERPGSGDDTRAWGPPFRGQDSTYFLGLNRDKKSAALDLTIDEDLDVARSLAGQADILIENFTGGVMERYGLDYDSIRRRNPGVIYCSVSSYLSAPELPGYDLLLQAASGFMSITGPAEGSPTKVGVAVLDVLAGLHACVAILAALAYREKTREGQRLRVGLFESSVASLVNQAANYLMGGLVPRRMGNQHPNIVPYESFEGSDSTFVVAVGNDKLYRALCEAIDRSDLANDQRFADNRSRVEHRRELVEELQREFSQRPVDHWVTRLVGASVPAAAVRGVPEVFESTEGRASLLKITDEQRGSFTMVASPFTFSQTPVRSDHRPPPSLGQDTQEIRARFSSGEKTPGRKESDDANS
jgi:crotonobetainyl-CoA:carnitine CoA-transferase CaiB-like acyl-CoA transferase